MPLISVLLFLLTLVWPINLAQAQSAEFSSSYSEFNSAYDAYQTAQAEFEIKRGQYIASKTVAATGEARNATYKLLQARDEAVVKYLSMIRKRLAEAVGVSTTDREIAFSNLDTEIAWFEDHQSNTSSAGSLEDMVDDSKEASDQYSKTTLRIIYKTLGQIAIGKELYLREKQASVVDELKVKLGDIRVDGEIDTDLFDRSIIDIANTINRSRGKNADATILLATFDKQANAKVYDDIVFRISEGVAYLKDANLSLREIIFRIIRG